MAGAYPRVRGDHGLVSQAWPRLAGLPPRARGSRAAIPYQRVVAGPTPACAGITFGLMRANRLEAAYPRVRGDHVR